jgi:uncharacterized protein (TIGR02147 family)
MGKSDSAIFRDMKQIFDYIDYRRFLADYYQEKKSTVKYFSYRYFAQKIGVNSPSFLKHVIDGERNLTPQMAERFSKALSLSPKEKKYFRSLVQFNQARTSIEKQEYYATLKSMVSGISEAVLNSVQFDFYGEWYIPVIRELISLYNCGDNFSEIASKIRPNIEPVQARNAIALLLRLGLIKRLEDGTYQQTSAAIVADGTVTSLAIRSFMHTMIDKSKMALDTLDKKIRHISGITMGVSSEGYGLIAEEIEAFKDRVKVIVNNDRNSNRIYQMCISLFPVSEELAVQTKELPEGE